MFDKKAYNKEYCQKHREEARTYAREYHKQHREKVNLARRVYSQTHKEQEKATGKAYYQLHKEREKENSRAYYQRHKVKYQNYFRERRTKLKWEVLAHYSIEREIKCSYCGITDIDVLCLDHIRGNGGEHRKQLGGLSGSSFYRWLKRESYPIGLQILCYNCNMKKRISEGKSG